MHEIAHLLDHLSLGDETTFLNFTAFPLLGTTGYVRDYLTLRAAVASGSAHVREVSEGGRVPELVIENLGKEPVIVFEGEELVGAKQNRTANVTVLAPPGEATRMPVTCVESGRWAYRSRDFSPSEQVHFSRGRANKMASVTLALKDTGMRQADQAGVWDDIASKSSRMRVAAPTNAMTDVFAAHHTRLEDYVGAFRPEPDQTGAVFAIGERIEGLELFDCPQTLAEMLPKLVRSYAIDAIESVASHRRNPTATSARDFFDRVRNAQARSYPAVGQGTELRISEPGLIAAGLIAEDRIVHLAAFAATSAPDGAHDPQPELFPRLRSRRRSI
jgi:hypothetical protein